MLLPHLKIFDAHLHIIDPRYPLVPNQGYLPDPFSVSNYLDRTRAFNLAGGAVVSGSFQAFDQTYLVAALKELGENFVGVTQLPATVSDEEIMRLDEAGIRAVRFNLKRGGSEGIEKLDSFARRIYDLAGWHVELYVDSKDLNDLYATLVTLPAVSIDHLGLSKTGFPTLLKLVEKGVHVKATGFGRVDLDVEQAMKNICSANPNALMFGTDLPSTRAPIPYSNDDLLLIHETLGDALARKVLYGNAVRLYTGRTSGR